VSIDAGGVGWFGRRGGVCDNVMKEYDKRRWPAVVMYDEGIRSSMTCFDKYSACVNI
jgi:hypothetical protein